MSKSDLTARQLAALMDIVTIARSRQSRTAQALRQDALTLGLKPADVDAALDFWKEDLRRRYPDARDLVAAHDERGKAVQIAVDHPGCPSPSGQG